jgi:CHASE1-domain containing sensor protein
VEKVSTDKLESFAEYYHRNIYPDFKVKAFSYESDRQWQEVEEAPYHLVIVFMEPSSLESRELLGLDIGSNEFLVRSSQKSEQQEESAVSTDPFTLVQGHLAYLLQRPIAEFGNADSSMYEDKRSGE